MRIENFSNHGMDTGAYKNFDPIKLAQGSVYLYFEPTNDQKAIEAFCSIINKNPACLSHMRQDLPYITASFERDNAKLILLFAQQHKLVYISN